MRQLRRQLLNVTVGCDTVYIAFAFFADSVSPISSKSPLGGRPGSPDKLANTMVKMKDDGTNIDSSNNVDSRCKVLLMHPPGLKCTNCGGWTSLHVEENPFPGDDPRASHSMHVLAPHLLPHARTIVAGATKCPFTKFFETARKHPDYPNKSAVFIRHPRQYHQGLNSRVKGLGEVEQEFPAVIRHLNVRPGDPRHTDITRQRERYKAFGQFQNSVDIPGNMADNMCIGFSRPKNMLRFVCAWNCEIINYSMRQQLSFNFAKRLTDVTNDVLYIDLEGRAPPKFVAQKIITSPPRQEVRQKTSPNMTKNSTPDNRYEEHQRSKLIKNLKTIQRWDEKWIEPELHRRFKRDLAELNRSVTGSAALCVGARLGGEVRALRKLGALAVGIDFEPGPRNHLVLYGSATALQFANSTFDLVYSNVLDHIDNLHAFYVEARRVLRVPGGLLLLDIDQNPPDSWAVRDMRGRADSVSRAVQALGFVVLKHQVVRGEKDPIKHTIIFEARPMTISQVTQAQTNQGLK